MVFPYNDLFTEWNRRSPDISGRNLKLCYLFLHKELGKIRETDDQKKSEGGYLDRTRLQLGSAITIRILRKIHFQEKVYKQDIYMNTKKSHCKLYSTSTKCKVNLQYCNFKIRKYMMENNHNHFCETKRGFFFSLILEKSKKQTQKMQPITTLALDQCRSPIHARCGGNDDPRCTAVLQSSPHSHSKRWHASVYERRKWVREVSRAQRHPPRTFQQHQIDTAKGKFVLTAATSTLLDRCAGVYFHAGLVFWGGRHGTHSVLDLRSHGHEGLLDVCGVLCAGLQERYTQLVGILLEKQQRKSVDWSRHDNDMKYLIRSGISLTHDLCTSDVVENVQTRLFSLPLVQHMQIIMCLLFSSSHSSFALTHLSPIPQSKNKNDGQFHHKNPTIQTKHCSLLRLTDY